jgi:hypothetical protein
MRYIILIPLFLFSCQSANKLVNKAVKKDKAEVAKITRELFPCGIIAQDTTVVIDTLTKFVECPESDIITIVKTDTTIDTIVIKKTVKVPVLTPQRTIYITQRFEDSAKIYLLQNQINIKQKTIDKLTNKLHNRKILIIWLIVGIICLLLLLKIIK